MEKQLLKAIVVDDQREILVLIQKILSAKGVCVRAYLSAEEAMREIEDESPDVVITDIKMPKIDGLEFIKSLRQKYPVVALTSAPSSDRFHEIMDLCDVFIDKSDMSGAQLYSGIQRAILRFKSVHGEHRDGWKVGHLEGEAKNSSLDPL